MSIGIPSKLSTPGINPGSAMIPQQKRAFLPQEILVLTVA